jgi:TDG/mug DNA glycosylase family protein
MTRKAGRSGGLPPVNGRVPKVLILGSFPSVLSLEKEEYYANPRNRFWAVMEQLLGISRTLPYLDRIQSLEMCGIVLWDVIATCIREGSGDGAIREPEPNDIPGFLRAHQSIPLVVLNGSTAGRLFRSAWSVGLPAGLRFVVMPSTSPANSRYRLPDLVDHWKVILAALEPA